jgi:hypothetical protein
MTEQDADFFRIIDGTLDLGDLPGGGPVPPPILNGSRSLWVGFSEPEADSLCWGCRAGYGNSTCTRLHSPVLAYDGSGSVTLQFDYWNDSEPCYDGIQVYLRRSDGSQLMLNPYPPGTCVNNLAFEGGFTDRIGAFDANGVVTGSEQYSRAITEAEIAASPTIQVVIEFTSDGAWSDEDCDFPTVQGPFGADDLMLTSNLTEGDVSYDWEGGLQGWTPIPCDPIGDFAGIADVGAYTILDPCGCRLSGNVLELHDGTGIDGTHPEGQHVQILGPICRLPDGLKHIGIDFDMYAEMPQSSGVFLRPGAWYYPYECPVTGVVGWSGLVGQNTYEFFGDDPWCDTWRYSLTEVNGTPVAPDAQMVRPVLELVSTCEYFFPCWGVTNETPLFDNIAVWSTPAVDAPEIQFDYLTQFMDNGSFPSALLDVRAAVPANVAYDKHGDTNPGQGRDLLGDSLVIIGPQPGSDPNRRWEARMWWRVARRGPFQADFENPGHAPTRYKLWKDRVSKGNQIDRPYRPEFTWGWMDSTKVGGVPSKNRFKSNYRENESQFLGETHPETEMIWDDALRPGTRIEYFLTSSYIGSPDILHYFPDTLGGNLFEFEALPGVRVANVANCGGAGFDFCVFHPATLYVDAYNAGAQIFIENALRTVLNDLEPCTAPRGCPIPPDRNWDRYDYIGSSACCNAAMARGVVPGSNNGLTVNQILGYRTILVNTGVFSEGAMQDEDFTFFDAWLTSPDCGANVNRQVFIMNGDRTGELLLAPGGGGGVSGPAFLANRLGASLFCDAFNGVFTTDPDCAPVNDSYCVRLLPEAGGPFGTLTDIDAFGNWCPNLHPYNAFSPSGGVGNRTYSAEDPPKVMSFAQVVNENLDAGANYRTVLDGVSYHHMTARNAGGAGESLCPRDLPSVVEAAISEIRAALRWGFDAADDAGIPKLTPVESLQACQNTGSLPSDLADGAAVRVNRLYPNEPNPFNPRTTIRFSLAQPGEVQLLIYDVNGRLVRTLVDGKKDAGLHAAVWDGANDEGHKVGSGVYWSQMKAGSFVSSKKMVVLK